MGRVVTPPALTARCLSSWDSPIGIAHQLRLIAPVACPNLHWKAPSPHSNLSRSHAVSSQVHTTTSSPAATPHRGHYLRLSEDCVSKYPGDSLAHSASDFLCSLHRERLGRQARHGARARAGIREAPRAMFSSEFNDAGPRKTQHARDAPVTFGGWYRDALADKRPPPLLGSLRPKQLQWMIRNFEETEYSDWADMAAEVLKDPVYQDRVEWTEYERRLEKNGAEAALQYAVSKGWVNRLDADAWDGVDPERIGTSLSRRIPRVGQEAPKATTVAGRTLQLGALAATPQGSCAGGGEVGNGLALV